MTLSLVDPKFLTCLVLLALSRPLWPQRLYSVLGAIVSALLIGLASPATMVVIGSVTLVMLYPLHRLYRASRGKRWQAVLVPAGIVLLVALLVVSKLERQAALPWFASAADATPTFAVAGFSYFLFRAIGFLHIQKILPIDERRPWALLFFTLFPSTITSGPIQKFQDFRQQLEHPVALGRETLQVAIYRITRGYFRKVFLAVVVNAGVERLLAVPDPSFASSALTVALLYLFFYLDFAGYSDIAIGFGLLLGIKVPENFRKPFQATSVTEFWRNWHITLVDWFRDNVFVPLGGLQTTRAKAAGYAFLIMLLCGLWHGTTLSFVAWGIWHGGLLFSEAMLGVRPMPPAQRHGPRFWLRVFWTNARVAFASIFFLPDAATTLRVLRGFASW